MLATTGVLIVAEKSTDHEALAQEKAGYVDPDPTFTYEQEKQECINTGYEQPVIDGRYIGKKSKKNRLVKYSKTANLLLSDLRNYPGVIAPGVNCDQYESQPRDFQIQHQQAAKGSRKMKPNSDLRTIKLADGSDHGTRQFVARFKLKLKRRHIQTKKKVDVPEAYQKNEKEKTLFVDRKKSTKSRVVVKKCTYPMNDTPKCKTHYYKYEDPIFTP